MSEGTGDGIKQWLMKVETKIDNMGESLGEKMNAMSEKVITLVSEMHHVKQRDDQQCRRIEKLEEQVDELQNKEHEHVGERRFIRVLVAIVGLVATLSRAGVWMGRFDYGISPRQKMNTRCL
ncbi:MAG: hypothetical protein OXT74_05750 [Candidatus Poribacteria bacterium]|nr:hypothetical protein [Candidatus Poribacteria bacterium]